MAGTSIIGLSADFVPSDIDAGENRAKVRPKRRTDAGSVQEIKPKTPNYQSLIHF